MTIPRPEADKMKLTEKQRQHLQMLVAGERSSYPGMHIGTLNSLALKKLVTARREIGAIASPRTHIQWRITDSGREALK